MTMRERLRTKLRRRAEYLIQSGAAERRPMTDEERKFFLDSIEQNAPNEFGLVKLSELQVRAESGKAKDDETCRGGGRRSRRSLPLNISAHSHLSRHAHALAQLSS